MGGVDGLMPVVIPSSPSTPSSASIGAGNGNADSFFIAEVRRSLRDQQVWVQESPASDSQMGAYGNPMSKPVRLQRAPVARTNIFLSAPPGLNQPNLTSYTPIFDPPPPIFNPTATLLLADGGAGVLPQGTYQVLYTYTVAGVEQGMSPLSNAVALQPNRALQVAILSNIPSQVSAINVYLAISGNPNVGLLGQIAAVAGATAATTFNVGGNGVLPALIITDTGELFFPEAPLTGTISVAYQSARFSDQQVTDALYEGLDVLWPEVWTPRPYDTTSVLPSPVQWEYVLPAAFTDPRTVIQEVEVRPPSAFVIYRRISGWRFINDSVAPTLIFERPPPPGGVVRIMYTTPYTALSQLPTQVQFLPIYYALARLMSDQEIMRGRADDLPALTAENAGSEKGGSLQTAAWWMQNMFAPALRKLSLGFPARRSVMNRTVERLGLGPIWQGMG